MVGGRSSHRVNARRQELVCSLLLKKPNERDKVGEGHMRRTHSCGGEI